MLPGMTAAAMALLAARAEAQPAYTQEITVSGAVDSPAAVWVNGSPAAISGDAFAAPALLQFGANVVHVKAVDAAGNSGSDLIVVYLALPAGQLEACCAVTVAGTVDPDSSVFVNGQSASVAGDSFSAEVSLAFGFNTLTAMAEDALGNQSSTAIQVFVDAVKAPPVIVGAAPAALLVSAGETRTLAVEAGDPEGGILFYRAGMEGTFTDWRENAQIPWRSSEATLGERSLEIQVMDASGARAVTSLPVFTARKPLSPR